MEASIREAIAAALKELGIDAADFVVEHPGDLAHGDYASNVALAAAKQTGKVPRELAEKLVRYIVLNKPAEIDRVEVAGPGFLNFYLVRNFFSEEIAHARVAGQAWGRNDSWAGKTVVVEYTDPNPFKEFHIGHLFTNAVGESISRLFVANGANVKCVNYQGDVGIHVACAIYGLEQKGATADSEFSAKELGQAYTLGATAYKADEAAKTRIKEINKAVYERSDESINALYDKGRETSLEYFKGIYELLGTQFDEYFFESEAGPRGRELVLEHPDIFPESDGARVFHGEEYGLHTRVFLNAEGLPTYEAKELALAKLKEERLGTYDHSVISTSNEITEYFKVLLKAMEYVYPVLAQKTEHIGHGTVRLASGKMSSRTGEVIPAVDFIYEIENAAIKKIKEQKERSISSNSNLARVTHVELKVAKQVAIAAIKYVTLRGSILQDSVFDKEQALSFEGDSGPYLQYTHARICSVLEKAAQAGVEASTQLAPPESYEIEKLLYRFPEVVKKALAERAPHQVVTFLTELAGAFNTFYAHEIIADPNDEYAPYKAAIADAVRQTLENGLWVLGIKAPQRM